MSTKTVELPKSVAVEVRAVNDLVDNELLPETTITKSLSEIKPKNKFFIYIGKIITRIIDIIAGIIGAVILIPLTIAIFIANRMVKDNGPIFYSQERIGKNGKIFKMIKYRSMVVNADDILDEYLENNPEAREEFNEYKKLKKDPRVTKVGKFLRVTSLDEMPQLLNVLLGQMTLVGPRPYLPREKNDMGECYKTIIKHAPGLTRLMAS